MKFVKLFLKEFKLAKFQRQNSGEGGGRGFRPVLKPPSFFKESIKSSLNLLDLYKAKTNVLKCITLSFFL